jgi:hypothetical protein
MSISRISFGPVADRLRAEPRLQRIFERVHQAGARASAELAVELLEHAGIRDPAALDHLLRWATIDADVVKALGADKFPRPKPRVVPRERKL